MWIQLTGLSLVTQAKVLTSLSMSSAYYLIDSGTSFLYLVSDAFVSFNARFCSTITGLSNASMTMTCGGNVRGRLCVLKYYFVERENCQAYNAILLAITGRKCAAPWLPGHICRKQSSPSDSQS